MTTTVSRVDHLVAVRGRRTRRGSARSRAARPVGHAGGQPLERRRDLRRRDPAASARASEVLNAKSSVRRETRLQREQERQAGSGVSGPSSRSCRRARRAAAPRARARGGRGAGARPRSRRRAGSCGADRRGRGRASGRGGGCGASRARARGAPSGAPSPRGPARCIRRRACGGASPPGCSRASRPSPPRLALRLPDARARRQRRRSSSAASPRRFAASVAARSRAAASRPHRLVEELRRRPPRRRAAGSSTRLRAPRAPRRGPRDRRASARRRRRASSDRPTRMPRCPQGAGEDRDVRARTQVHRVRRVILSKPLAARAPSTRAASSGPGRSTMSLRSFRRQPSVCSTVSASRRVAVRGARAPAPSRSSRRRPGTLQQAPARAAPARTGAICAREAARSRPGTARADDPDLLLEARVLDVEVEAAPAQRVADLARAVGGQDDVGTVLAPGSSRARGS